MTRCDDLFDYGYYIYQNSDYFKFSIDSILLAEFVKIKDNQTILDLCTGNIPIPLILTSKNQTLKITAVELQKQIYDLADLSIKKNNIKNIKLLNCNIKNLTDNIRYDIITCNPPYFKINEYSEVNENEIKRIARHEIEVTLDDVINCGYKFLKEKGNFYLVHRAERITEVIILLEKRGFGIRKIAFIQTNNSSKCEFFLLEASKYKKSDPKICTINIKNLKTYKNIFEEEFQ